MSTNDEVVAGGVEEGKDVCSFYANELVTRYSIIQGHKGKKVFEGTVNSFYVKWTGNSKNYIQGYNEYVPLEWEKSYEIFKTSLTKNTEDGFTTVSRKAIVENKKAAVVNLLSEEVVKEKKNIEKFESRGIFITIHTLTESEIKKLSVGMKNLGMKYIVTFSGGIWDIKAWKAMMWLKENATEELQAWSY